jgi:folate-dependent phosphoribosylglycinamide formyltransferase PurN
LLPAFNSKEPVKDAILAGVKVTGITIYYTKSKIIIAQYPVFINNNTHYDELVQELDYIEQTLFPLVIQKVLNNEPFEVRALLNKSCSGNCGGCSGCSH